MNVVHYCPYCGDEDLWPQAPYPMQSPHAIASQRSGSHRSTLAAGASFCEQCGLAVASPGRRSLHMISRVLLALGDVADSQK